jgi:hypothetical protein
VLFDAPVAERAREAGTLASTLYRNLNRFEEGMENLFDDPTAKRRKPALNLNEIANVMHACFRRRPDAHPGKARYPSDPAYVRPVRQRPRDSVRATSVLARDQIRTLQ